jgi:hypothetical protein
MTITIRRTTSTCVALSAVFLVGLVSGASAGLTHTARSHGRATTRANPLLAAAAQSNLQYSCHGTPYTLNRGCYFQTQDGDAPVFTSSGNIYELQPNDKVLITCWYFANSPRPWPNDGVQDHTTWQNGLGVWGHIPDPYINEGGGFPWDHPFDLARCG